MGKDTQKNHRSYLQVQKRGHVVRKLQSSALQCIERKAVKCCFQDFLHEKKTPDDEVSLSQQSETTWQNDTSSKKS